MSSYTTTQLHSALAAVRNYMDAKRGELLSAEQIHDLWNEWPQIPEPFELTLSALAILDMQGYVEAVRKDGKELWRRAG